MLLTRGLRQHGGERGLEERRCRAGHGRQHRERRDRRRAGNHEDAHRAECPGTDEIRPDHDRAARPAVARHAPDQQEPDQRNHLRREHHAEIGRRPGQLQHGERQGDARHAVADQRRRLRREQQPVVPAAQDREARGQPHREPREHPRSLKTPGHSFFLSTRI
jgi:hypothetical protein